MLTVTATDDWHAAHRGHVGLLEVSAVAQPASSAALDARKRATEARLRDTYQRFGRPDFNALPLIAAYARYYRRFGKTYHVQLQLESIVLKGKTLPSVSPLVDANFAAEVETLVLTAGHDVAQLAAPVRIDTSREGDRMVQMNGTAISPTTSHVLYVAYAPAGVGAAAVEAQLAAIAANIRLFCSAVVVEQQRLIQA